MQFLATILSSQINDKVGVKHIKYISVIGFFSGNPCMEYNVFEN